MGFANVCHARRWLILTVIRDRILSRRDSVLFVMVFHFCLRPYFLPERGSLLAWRSSKALRLNRSSIARACPSNPSDRAKARNVRP